MEALIYSSFSPARWHTSCHERVHYWHMPAVPRVDHGSPRECSTGSARCATQVAGRKRADKWRDRLLPGVDMGVDLVENALDTAVEMVPGDLVHGALSRTPFRRHGCAGLGSGIRVRTAV